MSDQPTPVSPTESSIATLTFPSQARKSTIFPLTRNASVFNQILGISLYTLFMAFNFAANQFLSYLSYSQKKTDPIYDGTYWVCVLALLIWLFAFIFPASTVLCGALFGSWRGTLISLLSIGGGLFIVHLLNSHFSHLEDYLNFSNQNLQSYLIAGPFAALVVGLIYDFRRDVNWAKSMLTMLLGMMIALFEFAILSTFNFNVFSLGSSVVRFI